MADSKGPPPQSNGPPGPEPDGAPMTMGGAIVAMLSFARYFRPVRGLIVLVLVTTVVTACIPLAITSLPRVVVSEQPPQWIRWLTPTQPGWVSLYLGFTLVVTAIGWVLTMLDGYWSVKAGEVFIRSLRNDLFRKLEEVNMGAVYARGPGEFVQQMARDVFMLRELFTYTLMDLLRETATGIAFLFTMFLMDWQLTLGLLVGLAVLAYPLALVNRQVERHANAGRDVQQRIFSQLVENVGGFRDIVASGRFSQFAARFDELLAVGQGISIRTSVWSQSSRLLPSALISLAILTAYTTGLPWFRNADAERWGVIITYAGFLTYVFPTIMTVVRSTTDLALATPSLKSVKALLDTPPPKVRPDAIPLTPPITSIHYENVSLEIDGHLILDGVTFDLPMGKLTAVIGPSGSGKTTIFSLLLRLLEPTGGEILVNGKPLEAYLPQSLRARIGYIPQTPFLFNQSIRENILLASPEQISQERLDQAVAFSHLGEVVAQRESEGGLDSMAGYMGNRLSGGEKQRIALARLVLRDLDVVICDEYTANVDVKTARLIHDAVVTHFTGRTRVMITHEPFSARDADWVLVLARGGKVAQQGTPDELCNQPGFYRDLLEIHGLLR